MKPTRIAAIYVAVLFGISAAMVLCGMFAGGLILFLGGMGTGLIAATVYSLWTE